MLRLGGAVILMKSDKIQYLVGDENFTREIIPTVPLEETICCFLEELSKRLREEEEARNYKDILTFAFWIRKANIERLKKVYYHTECRLGKGLIFHIAPSNVPINFAFSFVFGLLAGNGNIIRVSSKNFPQIEIVCRVINKVLKEDIYKKIREQNKIISYDSQEREITDYLSKLCDMRIIWGGDKTIEEVRRSPLSSRATEITFADRYSFGMIQGEKILEMSNMELKQLALDFYNDTYLMDQNACSSPHLIFWKGNKKKIEEAKEKLWEAIYQEAMKYELADIKVSDKYTKLCEYAVDLSIKKYRNYENILYIITLDKLPEDITKLRGKYGLFFEYEIEEEEELNGYINSKVQTCSYYGIEKDEIREWVIDKRLRGIDRIVPFGKALDIGIIWDGYDMIRSLSRIVC